MIRIGCCWFSSCSDTSPVAISCIENELSFDPYPSACGVNICPWEDRIGISKWLLNVLLNISIISTSLTPQFIWLNTFRWTIYTPSHGTSRCLNMPCLHLDELKNIYFSVNKHFFKGKNKCSPFFSCDDKKLWIVFKFEIHVFTERLAGSDCLPILSILRIFNNFFQFDPLKVVPPFL